MNDPITVAFSLAEKTAQLNSVLARIASVGNVARVNAIATEQTIMMAALNLIEELCNKIVADYSKENQNE